MPDPFSLITAPARLGLRLANLPLRALRRLTGSGEERGFEDGDPSAPEARGGATATVEPLVPAPARNGVAPAPAARAQTPKPRANRGTTAPRKRAAEPTKGEIADRREALREAEATADSPGAEIHVDEPWKGYAEMSAAQVIDRLAGSPPVVAAMVRLYEGQNAKREAVLHATEG